MQCLLILDVKVQPSRLLGVQGRVMYVQEVHSYYVSVTLNLQGSTILNVHWIFHGCPILDVPFGHPWNVSIGRPEDVLRFE